MPPVSLKVLRDKPVYIKPATPTEHSTVYLHNIDQQLFYQVELLFIYDVKSTSSTEDAVHRLRDALSKVLVPYNFAAGRFKVNNEESRLELDCNEEGALFAGAYCDSTIEELGDLRTVNPDFRKLVVYTDGDIKRIEDVPLLTVQVTKFKCGGVVVGMYTHHTVFDGLSAAEFYVDYGRAAGGEIYPFKGNMPTTDRSVLMPRTPPQVSVEHREMLQLPVMPAKLLFDPALYNPDAPLKNITKIFSFSADDLRKLKKMALSDGTIAKCSTFETLGAHIWKCCTTARADDDSSDEEPARMFVAMDMRHKLKEKPLPKNFSGNAVVGAPCFDATIGQVKSKPFSFAVRKVQEAIAMADEEYIRSQIDWYHTMGPGIINFSGSMLVSAWYQLKFDQLDFGWGKPSYVVPPVSDKLEFALMLSSCKNDGGIDVLLAMKPHQMPKLEELLKLCSI